jgi:hypothetical protein
MFVIAAGLAVMAAAVATPAAADQPKPVKMGDLVKAGYSCPAVGPEANLCKRGAGDPVYGCDREECKQIGVAPPSKPERRMPTRGLLDSRPDLPALGPAGAGTPLGGGAAAPGGRLQ